MYMQYHYRAYFSATKGRYSSLQAHSEYSALRLKSTQSLQWSLFTAGIATLFLLMTTPKEVHAITKYSVLILFGAHSELQAVIIATQLLKALLYGWMW